PNIAARYRKDNAAYASLPSYQIVKEQRTKTLAGNQNTKPKSAKYRTSRPGQQRPTFLELRSQNPVASSNAAVDERGYTHTKSYRQQPQLKKMQKNEKSFTR
ncbi:hypothetical protein, partial [uncultured Roseibium sp.]|uniref:hypothetical protein n=1 Tax=uncultured Roseibium sp. TaxID=1936171 RepID=UPI002603C806